MTLGLSPRNLPQDLVQWSHPRTQTKNCVLSIWLSPHVRSSSLVQLSPHLQSSPHIWSSPHIQSSPHIRLSLHVWSSPHIQLSPHVQMSPHIQYSPYIWWMQIRLPNPTIQPSLITPRTLTKEPFQGIRPRNLSKDPVLRFGQISREVRSLFLKFLLMHWS